MSETIKREDAVKAVHDYFDAELEGLLTRYGDSYYVCVDNMGAVDRILEQNKALREAIKAIPKAGEA